MQRLQRQPQRTTMAAVLHFKERQALKPRSVAKLGLA